MPEIFAKDYVLSKASISNIVYSANFGLLI